MTKEEKKEYDKKYYDAHKEENKEREKQYRDNHKKEKSEYSKQYREKNKKEIAERKRLEYINNKEQHQKYSKEYNNSHKESTKIRSRIHTIKRHGVTPEQYGEMFNKQEGKCAICGKHQDKLKSSLHVDHNHETNKIRGLLCYKCNSVLGYADDDIQILLQAIEYLKNNN
jgi:hypothetical protein